MSLIATPTKSLALHAIDGMLAFENIMNNRRGFGDLVNQENILHVLNNTGQIVEELRKVNVADTYHIWPLLLRYTYQSPVITCAKHIPLIRYLQREVPKVLKHQTMGQRIVDALVQTPEGRKWLVFFSFQGDLDRAWCSREHICIPVLIPTGISENAWCIADELEEALLEAPSKWEAEYFSEAGRSQYESSTPVAQGMVYREESKLLKSLLKTNPADLALMYITYFFPVVIRKLLSITTLHQFEQIMYFSVLDRHSYELLQLGMPAMYKTFELEYPDTIPEVSGIHKTNNKELE